MVGKPPFAVHISLTISPKVYIWTWGELLLMIKNLVTHLPRNLYQRTWIPKEIEGSGRKTFWIYGKRLCLCHVGEVTVVL